MYPKINVLSKHKKSITFFHLKFTIFKAVIYRSILHGHVLVMSLALSQSLQTGFLMTMLLHVDGLKH